MSELGKQILAGLKQFTQDLETRETKLKKSRATMGGDGEGAKGKWMTAFDWNPFLGSLSVRVESCDHVFGSESPMAADALEKLVEAANDLIANLREPEPANRSTEGRAEPPAPSAIELFAQRTLDLMPNPSPSKPPGDIILTISVIMVIVKLAIVVYDCWKDNHQITGIVYNPNWIQRLYLRRVVKRVLKDDGQLDKLNDVMSALLKMAKASSQEDIEAIFKEAIADPKIWTTATRLGLV